MVQSLGKSDTSEEKKKKKKRTETVVNELRVTTGAHAYRITVKRRVAASMKAENTKTKQNDKHVTPVKDNTVSANQQGARRVQVRATCG